MKSVVILAGILGILFLILSVVYFTTPASSLPAFLPGHDPNLTKIHFKHGIGLLLLALASFVFVWFQSGKKSSQKV